MRTLLAVVLLLAGCAPMTDATGAASAVPLLGSDWILSSMRGNAPVAGSTVTLNFKEESADGSGGCNLYRAQYTTSGSKLEFGLTSVTKRACLASELNQQESSYLGELPKIVRYEVTAGRLILRNAAGDAVLEFAKRAE